VFSYQRRGGVMELALIFIAINSVFWTLSLLNMQMDLRELRRLYRDRSTDSGEGKRD
jgi:hypothetical protein